jgi:putative oxidoreductase
MIELYDNISARLRTAGDWIWPLALRLIMFWEFWESGTTKYKGSNWFSTIEDKFPWPFSALGPDLNWLAATWGEMVFSVMVLVGLFTRFAAFSLIIITVVATAAVHWPAEWSSLAELWQGYAISDKGSGNYKLPLLFVVMLLPLVFHGGGKLSLDFIMLKVMGRDAYVHDRISDLAAAGWAFVVLGLATVFLVPAWGYTLLALGLACFVVPALLK